MKPTLITQQGGDCCKGHFQTTDCKLKTLIGKDAISWEFPVNNTAFISCNCQVVLVQVCGGRRRVASRIFRTDQTSSYLII